MKQNTSTQKSLSFNRSVFWQSAQFAAYFFVLIFALAAGFSQTKSGETNDKKAAIENALYTKTDFFGAQAIVPFPTAQARERLAGVLPQFPDDPEILLKLGDLDEKLGNFEAEENEIKAVKPDNLPILADFYQRRGQFEKEADVLEKILADSPKEKRGEAFSALINFAQIHDFKQYLAPEFYQKIIAQDDSTFAVFRQYIEKLFEDKNYDEALKILAENKEKFSELKNYFLEKEISILLEQKKLTEAEKVYIASFDPFWTDDESDKFYEFLRENNRYLAYKLELKQSFKKNPGDFQTAIRLIHLEKNDGGEIANIVRQIEDSRAKQKIKWQAEELLTVSHFLIESGDGDTASRFLYTLCADFKLETAGDLRRKVLYQLFELLSDAGSERIALTRGDLKFYETIAKSDANPGITTGILSLIFSDTNPRRRFEAQEQTAVKLFNRAAAYRIFNEFKTEYSGAPELAQMSLDIIRLYTKSDNLEVASETMNDFEQKYADFKNFPDAALKLADAYIAVKNYPKEREIYQQILDFLGKSNQAKFSDATDLSEQELTQIKPLTVAFPPISNDGIDLGENQKQTDYYYDKVPKYKNYLSRETAEISYADVLARFVASLARENKTAEILTLYADESAKYPSEQRLYEQMLEWLGQTNLTEKQLEVYQNALKKFPEKTWRDRYARWLIRNQRQEDFEKFSRELVENFDDAETQDYLGKFVDGNEVTDVKSFDSRFFLALYSLAHERFPHNIAFTKGLLRFYKQTDQTEKWRNLLAEYYFESTELRREFLTNLAKNGEMRAFLEKSENASVNSDEIAALPYKLFRADASAWLSDFEKSIVFYRELNNLYPNNSEFSESFITIGRSFGQNNRNLLQETATFTENQADSYPSETVFRTRAGEVQAELGNYEKAQQDWEKLIAQAQGDRENYLETATVFWDYFQFDDALKTIKKLREKTADENLYAFQAGAIYEAENNKSAAIGEYVKALDENEIETDKNGAKRRLRQLYRNPKLASEIDSAYQTTRKSAKNAFRLAFNYSDMFFQMKQQAKSIELLKQEVSNEKSRDNLLEAKQFFRDLEDTEAVRFALKRLVETAGNQRDAISSRLQLAENFSDHGEAAKSVPIINELVKNYPKNYGVLHEAENFFWDIGKRENSLQILRTAQNKARGEYSYRFSRKLAQRLNSLNRSNEAEQILQQLHTENPNDEDVFSELTDIYVRANQPELLRKTFAATIDAIRRQDLEPREFIRQTADLRKQMISAFTRLKDYDSAAEQYIEIINREPENEQNIDEAISFVKRYGGAENLLRYYQKTANESFKNYRWNVVLARIYEANNDLPNAAENYRIAIYNQPEMIDLYESIEQIYTKMQDYENALKTVEKMVELSGDEQKYLKQKIQILEKLGRKLEADAERQKIPVEELPKTQTFQETFAEANKLGNAEAEKAIEKYREAFEILTQNPFQSSLKSADIAGYVKTVHRADSLGQIGEKLWNLRDKLLIEISNRDSVNSGKARENLKTLDAAIVESIAAEVKLKATGNEISALRTDLENRLNNDDQTISLIQNLIVRCGFDDLFEKTLATKFNNSTSENRDQNLRTLLEFYQERKDFPRILEILENESGSLEYLKIYAQTARVLQNNEKELSALRMIFSQQKQDDEFTKRYFETVYETSRREIENLARDRAAAHRLQLINFLLSKNDSELSKIAIENSDFPPSWKFSRQAESSLLLKQFDAANEEDFVSALQTSTIGELVSQKPSPTNQLIGNDWFNLSEKYGRWLFYLENKEKAAEYLPAMTENHPRDADAQYKLGLFYLQQREFPRALEHFQIAQELSPNERSFLPYLGAAYFQIGEKEKASEIWRQIIDDENPTLADSATYLQTLADFGQTEKARNDINPILLKNLKTLKKSDSNLADLKDLLIELTKTFADENAKTDYFIKICEAAPKDLILPKTLIEESLINEKDSGKFYEILIKRADELDKYEHDYDYVSLLETTWNADEAESLLDSENDFEIEEPKNEKLEWREKYLEYLINREDFTAASKLIAEVENSLKGHYARPIWLRLAKIRSQIHLNNPANSLSLMKKFIGIEVSPDIQKLTLPNLERFNQVVKILQLENQKELSAAVREAFYARRLALEQFNTPNFTGLATVEFENGNSKIALDILRIMTNFSAEEMQAELAAMPLIAKYSNKENVIISANNSLSKPESLKSAAETAAKFGFFAEAVSDREKLAALSPDESQNRIELAKLRVKVNSPTEAVKLLLEILKDKNSERSARWKSVVVLAEIAGADENLWQTVIAENRDLETTDSEMWNALQAFWLARTNRADEAVKLLQDNSFTLELKFLKAVVEKNSGQDETALKSFSETVKANDELQQTFGFWENSPAIQMINLYLKTAQPRAAIDLAQTFKVTKMSADSDNIDNSSRLKMLGDLSIAAETIGDFAQAVEFENAKSESISSPEEKNVSTNRIKYLEQKIAEIAGSQTNYPLITEKSVSDF